MDPDLSGYDAALPLAMEPSFLILSLLVTTTMPMCPSYQSALPLLLEQSGKKSKSTDLSLVDLL